MKKRTGEKLKMKRILERINVDSHSQMRSGSSLGSVGNVVLYTALISTC